jgi:molybdenum cofactor cytidylyltransferase
MMQTTKINAILMASGFSRRFGSTNKLLAPFRGKPLARHTLELVCGLNIFDRVFFIAADDEVAALAEDFHVTVIRNNAPEKGQRERIRLGTAAGEAGYFMFFPCDQPLLDGETVRLILNGRKSGCITQAVCGGKPRSPVLFHRDFRDELLSLGEGEHGRDIITRHADRLIKLEINKPDIFADIDDSEMLYRYGGGVDTRNFQSDN